MSLELAFSIINFVIVVLGFGFMLLVIREAIKRIQPSLSEQELKEVVNKQIENKSIGNQLTERRNEVKIENAFITDILNELTSGGFSVLIAKRPSLKKTILQIAKNNIDLETGEVNPRLFKLIDKYIPVIEKLLK